jgi:hypothetical protein
VSNRRRLAGSRPQVPHCAICGRGIRAGMDRILLRDGRVVCAGCRDAGCLQRRLDCGHGAVPGNMVVYEGGVFLCAMCARESLTAAGR